MRRVNSVTVATFALLSFAGVASFMLPADLGIRAANAEPVGTPGYTINGTIRDFHKTHADFAVSATTGHVAGNLAPTLSAGGLPQFTGSGYHVNTEWRDNGGNNIAPQLYGAGAGQPVPCIGVHTDGTIAMQSTTLIDSFDSSLGQYGVAGNSGVATNVSTNLTSAAAITVNATCTVKGSVECGPGGNPATSITGGGVITGTKSALSSAFTIPSITAPTNAVVGASLGNVSYGSGAVVTINSNKHYNALMIQSSAKMQIVGNITILLDGNLGTQSGGTIVVAPGSSLDMYVKGVANLQSTSQWTAPSSLRLYLLSASPSGIQSAATFNGTIIAPFSTVNMQSGAILYGSFIGHNLTMQSGTQIHADNSGTGLANCGATLPCLTVADTAGVQGAASTGSITSSATFSQWFHDELGTNLSAPYQIFMTDIGSGVYEYNTSEFHPVDDRLFANEGLSHNRDFTYSFNGLFTYHACTGQFFEFEGDDDAWVFINNKLAMDRGGLVPGVKQKIDINRLGLQDGQNYRLLFLFAQRQDTLARFHIRTNLVLLTDPSSLAADAGFD